MNPEFTDNSLKYIEDASFIEWVNSGFVDHNKTWNSLKNNPSTKESIQEAIDMVKLLNFETKSLSKERKVNLFNRINNTLEEQPVIKLKKADSKRRNLVWLTGLAASFLILLTVFWPSGGVENVYTQLAENKNVILPDNSSIVINAKSELTYDTRKFEAARNLTLNGEAFFNVEKGTPFEVKTELGNVEVLGTSFNVYSRENEFRVACETGRVRVTSNLNQESVILTKGETCQLVDGKLIKRNHNIESHKWVQGMFHFEGEAIKNVIDEIERQFDITIDASKVDENELYTGFFEKGKLDNALESVFTTLGIKCVKSSDKVIELSK